MMNLSNIIAGISGATIKGSPDVSVAAVTFDSRKVEAGTLFVALSGTQTDGHKYIDSAVEKGAIAVICEKWPDTIHERVTFIKVDDSHFAMGIAASEFYERPSSRLKLIGVTGTNGKTSIATLLYNLFQSLGYKSGLISTVENFVDKKQVSATHTTPDPVQINALMEEMVSVGCDYCFMEVSSHAIHQKRIAGLSFAGAIFTNITHDHLDYHKTFDEYIKVKKGLFDDLPEDAFALYNKDDKNGKIMVQNTKAKKYSYSVKSVSDYKARIVESHFDGMLLNIDNTELWTKFVGRFNVSNLLAVYGTALLLNESRDEVLTAMSMLEPVSGRFECIRSKDGKKAIIDYAHTPDALLNVIQTIDQLREAGEKIITVVGTGGNRDKTKRPKMARIAAENSDKVVLTSDNPRDENPEDILADMMRGVDKSLENKVVVITDRKEAIKTAGLLANQGDVILIAGKGHETYQEIKGVKHHFDDKEIIKELFKIN